MIQPRASLEALVEQEELGLAVLHPGGLALTAELATLCEIRPQSRVLDVTAGTGETACFLAEHFGSWVVGLDASKRMVQVAHQKARARALGAPFVQGDAHRLPFAPASFEVVLCECTLSLLQKDRVLQEWGRVVRPGGYVAMHDLCWQGTVPERVRQRLWALEGERPERLDGWQRLFRAAGLVEVRGVDRSRVMRPWLRGVRKSLGLRGQARLALSARKQWGLRGLLAVLQSERLFASRYLGYGLVLGRKP